MFCYSITLTALISLKVYIYIDIYYPYSVCGSVSTHFLSSHMIETDDRWMSLEPV